MARRDPEAGVGAYRVETKTLSPHPKRGYGARHWTRRQRLETRRLAPSFSDPSVNDRGARWLGPLFLGPMRALQLVRTSMAKATHSRTASRAPGERLGTDEQVKPD